MYRLGIEYAFSWAHQRRNQVPQGCVVSKLNVSDLLSREKGRDSRKQNILGLGNNKEDEEESNHVEAGVEAKS